MAARPPEPKKTVRHSAWVERPKASSFKRMHVKQTTVAPFAEPVEKAVSKPLSERIREKYEKACLIVSLFPDIIIRIAHRLAPSFLSSDSLVSTSASSSKFSTSRVAKRRVKKRPLYDRLLDRYVAMRDRIGPDAVVFLQALQQLYILFSVPYRIGFLLDPYSNHHNMSNAWWFSLYTFSLGDGISYIVALIDLLQELVDRRKLTQIKPRTIDVISMMRQNPNAQATIVKLTMNRQESLRRRSSFMRKEASMKPEYLLSSPWDASQPVQKIQIMLHLVALVPVQLFLYKVPNLLHLASILSLIRLTRAPRIAKAIKLTLAENEMLKGFHNAGMSLLIASIFVYFVVIHWLTCIFMLVNHLECGYENVSCGEHISWAAKNQLVGPKLLHTYLYTLVVVAYGFPSPETNIERIVVIAIQFCRFLGGVSIISAFVFLFERQNRRRNLFSDKIDKIKEFLKIKQVSSEIKVKVLDFYDHFWTAQRGLEEDLIVASLPSHIQTSCLHHLRVRLLKSIPIVRAQPSHILNRLAIVMRRMAYSPRDWILHDEPSEHLYLVCRGRISILHPNSSEIHSYVLDGQFLGLSMMIPENKTRIRARAETYCDLYTLTRQDFVDVWMLCNPKNGQEMVHSMMEGIRQYLQAPHQVTVSHLTLKHKVYDDNLWFMPRSRFRMYWEWGILVALLYFSVDIPYRLCFEASTYFNPYFFSVSSVLDVFLVADVVLRCRFFAFVQDDVVVTNPKQIFAHYRANGLILDCISNIPFATVVDCMPLEFKLEHLSVAAALHLCEWLRFLRMRRLLPTITQVLKKLHVDDTTFVIVYLFFCVPLVCHVGSCVWYFLATWDAQDILPAENWNAEVNLTRIDCLAMARQYNNCTWLLFDNVEFGESSNYVRAFYWSVVSLVTVQFGSIFPFTQLECAYMFFWLFFGSIMNYGAIGALVNAVTRMNAATEAKEEHLMLVHRFMHSEGVSRRVHRDVSSYFKHRWTHSTEQEILLALQPLPDNLRQAIQSYLHSKAVAHIQIFHVVDKDELKFIYGIMSHRTYKKDEILVRAGDIGEELYIITRGSVELTLPINGIPTSILVIHAGACIGEAQFMPRTIYPLTATVVSASIDVSVLNRADFDSIIKHLESSIEDIELQSNKVIEKEAAWLASIRKNLDRRKIQHSMHRANSKGLFTDTSSTSRFIEPTMSLYRVWQVLVLIIVLYNFISIAYRVAFLLYPSPDIMFAFNILDYSTDAVFLIDMYIKFNHLTYSDRYGDQVINHKLIRSHYIWKGSFKLDLFSSLPLYYVGDYGIMTLCRLPRLARCFRLPRLWDDISLLLHELISSDRIAEYLEFYKLFAVLVLASHLAATGLYFISSTEVHYSHVEGEHIWFEHDKVIEGHHSNLYIMYLRSFYWGLGVLSSFDYMDIEMALLAETLWFCVVAITGVLFLGIVIGQTLSVINNAIKDKRELEHRIDRFTAYCAYQGLPRYLLERGKLFFHFQHDCNKGIDAHEVFADLPHTLRLDLFKDLYTSWVRNVPYFTPLPPAQIYGIAEKLSVQLFLPGDDIILEGDVATHFFIMKKGRAEKYLKVHMLVIGAVYEGLIFGEDAFFLGTRYTYCIRAVKCSEVLCLPLSEWNSMWSSEVRVEVEWRIKKEVRADCTAMKHAIQAITRNFGVAPGMRVVPVKLRTLILQGMHKTVNPSWNIALNYAQRQAQTSLVDIHGSMNGALANHKLVDLVRLQQDISKSIHVHPKAHSQSDQVLGSLSSVGLFRKVLPHHHEDVGVSVQKNHPVLPFEALSIWHRDAPPQPMWIPHSRFRETWDVMCLVGILYYAIVLPFRACFILNWTPLVVAWYGIEYVVDLFYLVDIVLRFNYFYEFKAGELQVMRRLVRERYWRQGGLFFDLLASIPFELIAIFTQNQDSTIEWQIVSLLRLNKLLRIVHFPSLAATLRRCCHKFHWSQSSMIMLKFLLSFVVPFCIAAHWMASVWFFMAYNLLSDAEEISWLVRAGYINGSTQEPLTQGDEIHLRLTDDIPFTSFNVYVASLYFATSSLTSQSFGDIVSTNVSETCLTIGIIVFSIIFYSLLTSVISDLMEEQLKTRSQFEQRMVNISTFFTYRRLPFQFFIQTSRFFRTLWQRQQGLTEVEFLSMLSPKVKEDIALYVKQSMVMSLSFLTMAHEVFIRSLVTVLETEQFVYADIIYQVGDVTRVLYFINAGSTTIVASKKTPLEKFKGALFGGRSLFFDEGRDYTAIANCDCECFLLYFNDFDILMERFPEYFDKCKDEWMHTERELDDEEEKPDQPSFHVRLVRRESNGVNRSERRGSATSHSSTAFSMMGD